MAVSNLLANLSTNFKNIFTFQTITNQFNRAFYEFMGRGLTLYDYNSKTYLEKGYNQNPTVYAIIQQMSTKVASVPLFLQKKTNEAEVKRFEIARKNYRPDQAHKQIPRLNEIRKKAFEIVENNPEFLLPPLAQPNPHQTWFEFFQLSEIFLKLTGNLYWYMPTVQSELASDTGQPYAIYCLPSPLMQIVLKLNADVILDRNPVDYYMLTEGYQYVQFPAEQVVHVTYANPNYSSSGEHLYGQSPLRAALKSLQASNEANDQNIKTMQNSGVFGFVHGKSIPLQATQAKELKSRLQEMDNDPGRLGRIAGISTDIGFTRLSLTADELRPFDYIKNADKDIANCLGWSTLLLNNTEGAKYDNLKEIRQRVITDSLLPDLTLIEEALNRHVLPRFKGYEKTYAYFDISLLPEMQADLKELVDWLTIALADGVINRDEYREAINYSASGKEEMLMHTVQFGLQPLEDAVNPLPPDVIVEID